jgi:hypothetical protein
VKASGKKNTRLLAIFLFRLFYDPECGGDTIFRNVGRISTHCTVYISHVLFDTFGVIFMPEKTRQNSVGLSGFADIPDARLGGIYSTNLHSSAARKRESYRFHLRVILRLTNRCDPDPSPSAAADTQLCAEVCAQLIFSHGYYNVNRPGAPASSPAPFIATKVA